jgi:hypothetical protein
VFEDASVRAQLVGFGELMEFHGLKISLVGIVAGDDFLDDDRQRHGGIGGP